MNSIRCRICHTSCIHTFNRAFLFRPLRLRSSLNTSTLTCKQILLEFSNLVEVEGIELAGAFDFDDFVLVELGKIEVEFLAELQALHFGLSEFAEEEFFVMGEVLTFLR